MRTIISTFQEGVVGDGYNKAYIDSYHRTGPKDVDIQEATDIVKKIVTQGFKPGYGDTYGKGLYSTGDWLSQFGLRGNSEMLGYGSAIIKYRTPARNVLIFDYRVSKKLYGGRFSLRDQCIDIGICSVSNVPEFIDILSNDLLQTVKDPRVSANRAYWFWSEMGYQRCKYSNVISRISTTPELQAAYTKCKSGFDLYNSPKTIGIAFSGNNDGNVLFIKESALKYVKPLQYCVMDPNKGSDPRAFIVPWTPISALGKSVGMGNIDIKDTLAAVGIPKGSNTLDEVYVYGFPTSGTTAAVEYVKQSFKWTRSPVNRFRGIDVAFGTNGEDYIFGGEWLGGDCDAYYFGTPNNIKQKLNALGRTQMQDVDDIPKFYAGNFNGGEFAGIMIGGVFKRGVFNGEFKGGLFDFDGRTSWGNNAKRTVETSLTCTIKYQGKIYRIGDESPEKFLANLKAGISSTGGASVNTASSLADAIKSKLRFKVEELIIKDNWRGVKSIELGFAEFKKSYNWFWQLGLRWNTPPAINVENDTISLIKGELAMGDVYFDTYAPSAVILGGNLFNNKNAFEGEFKGGNYRGGTFNGKYMGGMIYLDHTIWGKNAQWELKGAIGFVVKDKHIQVPDEMLLFKGPNGKPKYDTPQKLMVAVRSGEYEKDSYAFKRAVHLFKMRAGPDPRRTMLVQRSANVFKYNVGVTQADIDAADDTDEWDDDDGSNQESSPFSIENLLNEKLSAGNFTEEQLYGKKEVLDEDIQNATEIDFAELQYAISNRKLLTEKEYTYGQLSDTEQDKLYDVFYNTYSKTVGASFDRDDFDWRAQGWLFYGDAPDDSNPNARVGGISVRKQQSNDMYKLTSSFGHPLSVLKGFSEFSNRHGNSPSWAIVTTDIAKMITKRDKNWKTLPGVAVKAMEGMLKKITNGEVLSVGITGVMKVSTPAGTMDKVFLANTAYIDWLLDSIENPANAQRLPLPQIVLKPVVAVLRAIL